MPNLSVELGNLAPVIDQGTSAPNPGIGLCLSGGGYRSMIFHLGAIIRLNEIGYLPKLKRISSVSGGSITAAMLGLKWKSLNFSDGVASNLTKEIIDPIRAFAHNTVDVPSVIRAVFLPGTINDKVVHAFEKYLFGDATLQDLPDDPPRFVINATNVQSGALFRFSKPYIRDYKVGAINNPSIRLSVAVAASSAFPPFLSPAFLELDPTTFNSAEEGESLTDDKYRKRILLTDGGVYDNLGMETVWKHLDTVLVSDAGMKFSPEPKPTEDWARHSKRVLDLIDNQVRSLRKRQLINSFQVGLRKGSYWGISTNIAKYNLPSSLLCSFEKTSELAAVPTRFSNMPDRIQERLINWGYAVCDAALRSHVDSTLTIPIDFPYPGGV